MKRAARLGVSVSGLLLLIASFWGWRTIMVCVRTPQLCVFSFDTVCSMQFQQDVNDYAQQLGLRLAGDPEAYAEQLKKQFPFIGSIQTELAEAGTLSIAVECARPVCCVNQDIVVASSGVIGPVGAYEAAIVDHLPHFSIVPENMQSWSGVALCSIAARLSSSLREQYAIELGNYPELTLVNKEQPKMSFRSRADLFDAKELEERAEAVLALLTERGAFAGKKQRSWVADMRFVKQIVLVAN